MSVYRGVIMQEIKCKYCGHKCSGRHYIKIGVCTNCDRKRPLVRKLLQMVKDTFEMYGGKDNER